MSLLSRHLEQISLSAESIATLPFLPPKIFTNALLSTPDITSLIRDTEPHERALFSVPPPPPPASSSNPFPDVKNRRQTVFNVAAGGEVTTSTSASSRVPRRNTAVAAVLGSELHSQVKKTEGKGEIDIEVLLRGVEKLNAVYEVRGVPERVHNIRAKYGRLKGSVDFYERKVQRLGRELESINRGDRWEDGDEDEDDEYEPREEEEEIEVTDEDLRREEEEIRELERRKRELEERVSGMERDLGVTSASLRLLLLTWKQNTGNLFSTINIAWQRPKRSFLLVKRDSILFFSAIYGAVDDSAAIVLCCSADNMAPLRRKRAPPKSKNRAPAQSSGDPDADRDEWLRANRFEESDDGEDGPLRVNDDQRPSGRCQNAVNRGELSSRPTLAEVEEDESEKNDDRVRRRNEQIAYDSQLAQRMQADEQQKSRSDPDRNGFQSDSDEDDRPLREVVASKKGKASTAVTDTSKKHQPKKPKFHRAINKGIDRTMAKLGIQNDSLLNIDFDTEKPDKSKEGKWLPGKRVFNRYDHADEMDWEDKEMIKKLNSWRHQILNRNFGNIRPIRPHWIEPEKQLALVIMKRQLQTRKTIKWRALANEFNKHFQGTTQKKGELLLRKGMKKQGCLYVDRPAPWRKASAIRTAAEKWEEYDTLKSSKQPTFEGNVDDLLENSDSSSDGDSSEDSPDEPEFRDPTPKPSGVWKRKKFPKPPGVESTGQAKTRGKGKAAKVVEGKGNAKVDVKGKSKARADTNDDEEENGSSSSSTEYSTSMPVPRPGQPLPFKISKRKRAAADSGDDEEENTSPYKRKSVAKLTKGKTKAKAKAKAKAKSKKSVATKSSSAKQGRAAADGNKANAEKDKEEESEKGSEESSDED
ncbi:hypothetical protein G7Y89_g11297 [Cudoniella acicularis]|uniref:DASH complex subunit SPC34 n=1 Tax=Cudoniella acicularis TaxID=354080 RepID=A0A8H4VYE6_9HELO|nr:hypothetical protein G7Y89_g11297 [Cudoniella acicularis]